MLRAIFLVLLPFPVLTVSAWGAQPIATSVLEVAGTLLIALGVIGRFWAILYSGGRKSSEVVKTGPYSICRHPLYLFSTMAVAGFGLLLGSLLLMVLYAGLALLVLRATAYREEEYLIQKFGDEYLEYKNRVPAIIPSPALFHSPENVEFSVKHLRRTFTDALVFLAFIPLAQLINIIREYGHLAPVSLW